MQAQRAAIFLKGLRLQAYVGVLPEEYNKPQELLVDCQIFSPSISRSGSTARLADGIDYAVVREIVITVCQARHYALLEELAVTIGQALTQRFTDIQVELHIAKTEAFADVAAAGVSWYLHDSSSQDKRS